MFVRVLALFRRMAVKLNMVFKLLWLGGEELALMLDAQPAGWPGWAGPSRRRWADVHQHEAASGAGVAASVAEAASGASVTASVANFDMDAPADFFDWERLRKTEMFQKLFRQVQLVVTPGMERQCLSHLTTASCRRDGPPVESLKSCGMDTPISSPFKRACVHLHVHLSHSFYNDDSWGFHYYSPACPKMVIAQKIAYLEILTTLLSMQPNIVRIPPGCVIEPSQLRDAGRQLHQARLFLWTDPFASVTRWEPLVTDDSIHAVSGARQYYTPGTSDMEILSVLKSWAIQQSQQAADSRRLPKHALRYLRAVLPRGGLCDFFVRNKDAIRYWCEGKSICFQFRDRCLESIGAASGAHAEAGLFMILDGQIDDNDASQWPCVYDSGT